MSLFKKFITYPIRSYKGIHEHPIRGYKQFITPIKQIYIHPGVYKHYKGVIYTTIKEAIHTETNEVYIVYYSNEDKNKLWIRPKSMFEEHILHNNINMPRFEYISKI
jgi:hypothetical protein